MGRSKDSPEIRPAKLGVYNLEQAWWQSSQMDKELGLSYYPSFQVRLLTSIPGIPLRTLCGVYAALSPNNSEDNCLRDTRNAISLFKAGKWEQFRSTTYRMNHEKARRILDGEDPDLVLTGPKTNAFYHNMLDPSDKRYVTIDGHMVNIWNNIHVPLDLAGINAKEYNRIASGVQEVSSRLEVLPSQFQAVVWGWWKRTKRIVFNPQMRLDLGDVNDNV